MYPNVRLLPSQQHVTFRQIQLRVSRALVPASLRLFYAEKRHSCHDFGWWTRSAKITVVTFHHTRGIHTTVACAQIFLLIGNAPGLFSSLTFVSLWLIYACICSISYCTKSAIILSDSTLIEEAQQREWWVRAHCFYSSCMDDKKSKENRNHGPRARSMATGVMTYFYWLAPCSHKFAIELSCSCVWKFAIPKLHFYELIFFHQNQQIGGNAPCVVLLSLARLQLFLHGTFFYFIR